MGASDRIRGNALPKARQWIVWLSHQLDVMPHDHGWEACVRDTLVDLHHGIVCGARRLRGNPIWDIQGTMTDDTESLEERAIRNLKRLQVLRVSPTSQTWLVPERFQTTMDCLDGACRQQVRLAKEIDSMRRNGELIVDVTLDRAAQRLVEVG